MAENIINTSDASFEADVLQSGKPVLVDFWATWCGPCKMIAPILDQVAKEYSDRVAVAKMDVDRYQEIAGQFGVRSIPTLILFKNGQMVAQKTGLLTKVQLKEFIDSNL